jgi:hypothetical protein
VFVEMAIVSPGKLDYIWLTLIDWATCHRILLRQAMGNLGLDGQTGAVFLGFFVGSRVCRLARMCSNVISHFVDVISLQCNSLSTPKLCLSVIRFSNSLPSPLQRTLALSQWVPP